MEITLKINGEDKTFTQEFAPLKIYRRALEIEKYTQEEDADIVKVLDKRLDLVVEIFDKQFTKDQIEDGLNAFKHKEVLYNIIGVGILGYAPVEEKEQMGKFLEELKERMSQSSNKLSE